MEKLMIKNIFTRASVVARLETGTLGWHLDSLATTLQNQRYAISTISVHLREAHAFGLWINERHQLGEISELMLKHYLDDLSVQSESLSRSRRRKITTAVNLLLYHLRQTGVIAPPPAEISPLTEAQQCLASYEEFLEKVQGLAPTTRRQYLRFASRLLNTISQSGPIPWPSLNADKIIEFVLADASPRKGFGPHTTSTAIRSLLRFLVSQGRLSSGLETAIPNIPRWSHAALPQRLSETDINRLLTVCDDGTAIGRRNYAILILLSRLGLRAKEVVGMQLGDLDWANGSLLVRSSKTHSERLLPMAQEVGEALVSYLKDGRPATSYRQIFLDHTAPFQPLQTASAITKVVKRLLAKAGIERRSSGAHLFRHTVASQMVNHGASFKEVADVLGHQNLQTTGIYAKLDLAALSEAALPWPGGAQ
jgi:integrase/recombinase XerD